MDRDDPTPNLPARGPESPPPSNGRPPAPRSETSRTLGSRAGYDEPLDDGVDWRVLFHLLWCKRGWILAGLAGGMIVGVLLMQGTSPIFETRGTVWVEERDSDRGPIQGEDVFEGKGWSELMVTRAVLEPVVQDFGLHVTVHHDAPLTSSLARLPGELTTRLGLAGLIPTGGEESRAGGEDGEETGESDEAEFRFGSLTITEDLVGGTYRIETDSAGGYVLYREGFGQVESGELADGVGRFSGFRWTTAAQDLEPGQTLEFSVRSTSAGAARLRNAFEVVYEPRAANLIATTLSWPDPEQGVSIHNAILDQFIDVATRLKTQKLREVVSVLSEQTRQAAERLATAELALERERVRTITLPTERHASPIAGGLETRDPVFGAYFERKLELAELEAEVEDLEGQLRAARQGSSPDPLALELIPSAQRSPELAGALDELMELRSERRGLLDTYTTEHPSVRDLDRRIARIESRTIPTLLESLIGELQNRIASLSRQVSGQATELRRIPSRVIEETRLRREMEMAEELHGDLLGRLKEAELALATNRPDLQLVDQPTAPPGPTSDEGPRFFLLASLAGLGLGIAGVIVRDRLDQRVKDPDQVQDVLGLPLLGVVPRIPGEASASEAQAGIAMEAFRSLRSRLVRQDVAGPLTILVTSAEPREGKSLVAANLAISFASAGRKTLLVDTDTRRGKAHQFFGLPNDTGFVEFIREETRLTDGVKDTEFENLALLPRGRSRGFDRNLLESQRIRDFLEVAPEMYDVVLLDAPPLAAGADALVLAELCRQTVLVLRAGATDTAMVHACLESMRGFDLTLAGVVLNDVPETAHYYRYYSPYVYYQLEGEEVA